MIYVPLVLSVVAVIIVATCAYNCTRCFSSTIWGTRIPCSPKQRAFLIINRILLVAGSIALIVLMLPSINSFFMLLFTNFLHALIFLVVFFGSCFLFPFIAMKKAQNSRLITHETNALVLGNIAFVKMVEENMAQAFKIIVSQKGIALVDNTNNCYFLERYEDHGLSTLSNAKEVSMIGMYFAQKYHDTYSFVVDFQGNDISAGGVSFGFTPGASTSVFRSFIFVHK